MIQLSKKAWASKAIIFSVSMLLAGMSYGQTTDATNEEGTTKVKSLSKTPIKKVKKKQGSAIENNPTLANLNGGGSGWRLQGTLTHTPRLREDQEDTTDILLRADYNINKKHTIRVQQFFTKFYDKFSSEDEFKPFDTTVAHFYRLSWRPLGMGLQWRNQISLPISNESNRDDLFTVYRTSMIMSKAFLGGKLLAFGVPYGRYFFYEYKTSQSGRLLPRAQGGLSLGALYFATPKLSFYGGGDYRYDTVYTVDGDSQIPQGTYRFDLDMSYQWTTHLTTSLSYAQGRASFIQDGRYELALFDDQASRVTFGLTYIY
ncbi:MAG: hypothetical protein AAF203_06020 [Pseudomonadota bacterium]